MTSLAYSAFSPADGQTSTAIAILAAHPLPCRPENGVPATLWATLPPWACEGAAAQEAYRLAGADAGPAPPAASFSWKITLAQQMEDLYAYRTFFFGKRNGLILVRVVRVLLFRSMAPVCYHPLTPTPPLSPPLL